MKGRHPRAVEGLAQGKTIFATMKLHVLLPSLSIAPYVHNIVVLENSRSYEGKGHILPLIANGYPSLSFQVSDPALSTADGETVDALFLLGQNIQPLELFIRGSLTLITYFFYPPVVRALFGYDAQELTNFRLDISGLPPAKGMHLCERLVEAGSLEERLAWMDRYILKLAEPNYGDVSRSILHATQAIRAGKGLVSLKHIQEDLRVTERTFQRLFDQHVGVTPRMYSRICQFHAAFQQLSECRFERLSDVAYDNGYADQSHFIRAFREFTNNAPLEYLGKRPERED